MKTILILLISIPGFCFPLLSHGQSVDTLKYCVSKKSIGLGGYDPITYFQRAVPILGNTSIQAQYEGIVYYFSSERNKKLFLFQPERYLPQFGGWCSMTLVLGKATKPTYTNFLVQDQKLYLFERTLSVNGKELWLKDRQQNEKMASLNYNQYKVLGRIR